MSVFIYLQSPKVNGEFVKHPAPSERSRRGAATHHPGHPSMCFAPAGARLVRCPFPTADAVGYRSFAAPQLWRKALKTFKIDQNFFSLCEPSSLSPSSPATRVFSFTGFYPSLSAVIRNVIDPDVGRTSVRVVIEGIIVVLKVVTRVDRTAATAWLGVRSRSSSRTRLANEVYAPAVISIPSAPRIAGLRLAAYTAIAVSDFAGRATIN